MEDTKITISTHNVNGFGHSKSFLFDLCEKFPNAIRGIQEHWLAPPYKKQLGVNRLRSLHPDFDGFGNSAMKRENETKVRMGRPFGGTGFLFPRKYSQNIKPLIKYNHERVSIMQMTTTEMNVLLISVYLPFYNTRDLQNSILNYQETLSFVEMAINENPHFKVILLLDANCNPYDSGHPYSKMITDFMARNSLLNCYDLNPSFDRATSYSRCDKKTNSFTLIDAIFISKSLSNCVSNVRISDYGDNVSDHLPVEIDFCVSLHPLEVPRKRPPPSIVWHKLDADTVANFRQIMTERLDEIVIPFHDILHGDKCCSHSDHIHAIQNYYDQLVAAIRKADESLPRSFVRHNKPFWSDNLTELKQGSIDCCNKWKENGSPRSGPLYECKRTCTKRYKTAVKAAKSHSKNKLNEQLYDDLASKNSNDFWKCIRNKTKDGADSPVTRVNGETTELGISNAFREHFQSVYSDNNTPAHESLRRTFHERFEQYFLSKCHDSIASQYVSWDDMLKIMECVKIGKSTAGFVRPEHLLYGSEKLVYHLQLLFNAMIQHGCVVNDFLKGTITPVIKDASGDVSDTTNYRPITIGSLLSKLFEKAIDLKISPYLESDDLQFGFKKKTSTSHALFVLKNTVNHFTERGSNVFASFLDCSKAFDRISHYGLFLKLMDRSVPLSLLLLIIAWHLNMSCRVKWGDALSDEFNVPLGTKQGGIISPKFFSIYIDDMVKILRNLGVGCHVLKAFVACILFADDMALLAPSRKALQIMMDHCLEYCNKFCLTFNARKSKVMVFGKSSNDVLLPLSLNGSDIEYVQEWKYLGTTVGAGKWKPS